MIASTHYMGVPIELIEKLSYLKEEEVVVLMELATERVEIKQLAKLQQKYAGRIRCVYYDCGWCYASDKEKTNSSAGTCPNPVDCPTYIYMSMSCVEGE